MLENGWMSWGLAGFLLSGCGESLTDSSRDAAEYVVLAGGGQTAEFLFGDPAASQKASDEPYLSLDDDLNRAMCEGKEFEQKVIDSLDKGKGK